MRSLWVTVNSGPMKQMGTVRKAWKTPAWYFSKGFSTSMSLIQRALSQIASFPLAQVLITHDSRQVTPLTINPNSQVNTFLWRK
jgi:hypothetical protein